MFAHCAYVTSTTTRTRSDPSGRNAPARALSMTMRKRRRLCSSAAHASSFAVELAADLSMGTNV